MHFAHGVGRVYELPIPLSLYLIGAAVVVAVSFVIQALATRDVPEPAVKRIGGPAASSGVVSLLRVAGLAWLGLLVYFALTEPEDGFTPAPLMLWVALVIGGVLVGTIIDGTWHRASPWAAIEGLYRIDDEEPSSADPDSIPWWIGPLLLYALFWFELVSGRGFDPGTVLLVVIAYTAIALLARPKLGPAFDRADPFSILFGFAGRCAPLALDEEGISYRGLSALHPDAPMPRALFASVFVLLAATTMDNVRETVEWFSFLNATGLDDIDRWIVETAALALLTLPFLLAFLGAVLVAKRFVPDRSDLPRLFGWSLIPIGIAYVLAHNAPLVLLGVPELLSKILGPLGSGLENYLPSPKLVWFLEIALIVGGHVMGVVSAHRIALRVSESRRGAAGAHLALTVLMCAFTIATLYLLARPIVTEA